MFDMAAQELPQELSSENQTPRGNNAVKWPHHFVASLDEDKLGPAVVELFENYSHVPRSKLKRHVEQVVCVIPKYSIVRCSKTNHLTLLSSIEG